MANKTFIKDFSWYFLGSLLPLLIGFIKTPIFTRHFDQEAYGYLGLVTITFSYLGMLLFSAIGSCVWRYYNQYKVNKQLTLLYSNLFFLYGLAVIGLLLVSVTWYFMAKNTLVKQLLVFSFLQLLLNQLFLLYMVLIRLKGKAAFYTIFQTIRAVLGLLTALLLVFKYDANISGLVLSLVIIDGLAILFLAFINPAKVLIRLNIISKKILKELLHYGSAGLIINIGFLIIASSDRYIIAGLTGLGEVGIYDQVYKISQLSVMALVTVYFNTINPSLLKEMEANFKEAVYLIQKYMRALLLFGLPIIIYLSIFSKDLASLFLGVEFRVGYTMMPFIFLAAYLHGISNFYELRLKFSNKLRKLGAIVITTAILNIVLNYIFVATYGYQWAAVTTTISYLLLIGLFHYFDQVLLTFPKNGRTAFVKAIIILLLQVLVYLSLLNFLEVNLPFKIALILLFIASYVLLLKKELMTTEIPIKF